MEFNIEQIRTYILSQDSLGDVLYNLSEKNILKANTKTVEEEDIVDGIAYPGGEMYNDDGDQYGGFSD